MRWRAEHEKTGYEHRTPVTVEALAVLHETWERTSGHEDAPVLPAPTDPSKCAGRSLVRAWWYRAQTKTPRLRFTNRRESSSGKRTYEPCKVK